MKARRFYDCAKYGLAVTSFEIEMLDGADEVAATERAGPEANLAEVQEQIVAEAICRVNGEDVVRPFLQWSRWDGKTRTFARMAVRDFMEPGHAELVAFLATENDGVFDASGLNLAFRSLRVGKLDGTTELAAIRRAGPDASALAIAEELLVAAVAELDGKPAPQPFGWGAWDIRSRRFLRRAVERVTRIDPDELEDFLQAGRGEAPGDTEPG